MVCCKKFIILIVFCVDMVSIRLFVTGGTFDKEYNEITGELFFKNTHLNDMLGLGRYKLDIDVRTLMMIDSLEMTGGTGS